jgi:hypothetical protein
MLGNENSYNNLFGHEKHKYVGFKVQHQILYYLARLSDSFHHKHTKYMMS